MKVLAPAVTVIMVSHCKPQWLPEALDSLLAQTRKDFEVVLADSGMWIPDDARTRDFSGTWNDDDLRMRDIRRAYSDHPLISWYTTGELPALPGRKCPLGWSQNLLIRNGLVRGRYFCLFFDDDLYKPTFIERMAGFLDDHPEAQAVWCSQDQMRETADGFVLETQRIADRPKASGGFDCQVDGGQVMMRTSLLDLVGDPWMAEDPSANSCSHIDGLFFEAMAVHAGVVPPLPNPEVLCVNRRTQLSRNRAARW